MSEQTRRTFIGSRKLTLGRRAEPNLAGWMHGHERLYFKGHTAWNSEFKNRGGERAKNHPAGKDYTRWAETAWLQRGAWPDQGKLGWEARAMEAPGLPASPGVSCFHTRGEMGLTSPLPLGEGWWWWRKLKGTVQSSPPSKGEHLPGQGSAEGHRNYRLLPNLILWT